MTDRGSWEGWVKWLIPAAAAAAIAVVSAVLTAVFAPARGAPGWPVILTEPGVFGACVGLLLLVLLLLAGLFAQKAFSSRPRNVLEDIRAYRDDIGSGAGDVLSPRGFYREPGGVHDEAYRAAKAFALDGAGRRRGPFRFGVAQRFRWTILNGEPGVGKSELARHLARELGRRDRLGDTGGGRFRRLKRLQVWLGLSRLDPWDAGAWRREVDPADFRPRRPTLILLDDWDPTTLAATLKKLAATRSRHPVRVLVVDQNRPAGLRLGAGGEALSDPPGGYAGRLPSLGSEPVKKLDAFLNAALGADRDGPWREALWKSENKARFLRVTEGNPLLILLGVEALRGRASLETLSRMELLRGRVETLFAKLDRLGLGGDSHLDPLMVSTLAGGPVWARWTQATASAWTPARAMEAFPYLEEAGAWSRTGVVHRAPVIRPDLIGHAALHHRLASVGQGPDQERATEWVRQGWACDPGGMVRAARRLGRPRAARGADGDAHPDPETLIARAMAAPPPLDAFPDLAAAGPELVRLAVAVMNDADYARQVTAAIDPDAILTRADAYAAAFADPFARVEASVWTAAALIDKTRDRAMQTRDGQAALIRLATAALQARIDPRPDQPVHAPAFQALHRAVGPIFRQDWDQAGLKDEAAAYVRSLWAHGSDNGDSERQLGRDIGGLAQRLWSALTGSFDLAALAGEAAKGVGREIAWIRAAIWRHAANNAGHRPHGEGLAETEARARMVDGIVSAFPMDDRDLQYERAEAWCHAALAASGLPDGAGLSQAESHARTVDGIVSAFPIDDRALQFPRAEAWRHAAFAASRLPDGAGLSQAEAHARTVDGIASAFPIDDRALQFPRAEAWSRAAYAAASLPHAAGLAQAEAHVRTVDGIVSVFPMDDRALQFERAEAWRNAVVAAARLPHGAGLAQAEAYARTVNDIVSAFAMDDRRLRYEVVAAWRFAAIAAARLPHGAGLAQAEAYARTVDGIVSAFPENDRDFQFERAEAWRFVAYAAASLPHGAGLAQAEAYARTVDGIASAFPMDDRALQFQRARAWSHVAFAAAQAGSGARERLADAVAGVEAISRPFDDAEMRGLVTTARGYLKPV